MRALRFSSFAKLALALLLFSERPAFATQYETEINIETEQDLYELNARGAISDDTLEELVDLLRNGVDLNTANREDLYELPGLTYADCDKIIQYRTTAGRIDDPADLVRAGVLSQEQLSQIAPFLEINNAAKPLPVSGIFRAVGGWMPSDPVAPPYYSQLRMKGPLGFSGGFVTTGTRQRIGTLEWNDSLQALTATEPRYGVELPKFFLQWKGSQAQVILGTFRAGFGQRLTLDNTSRTEPNGIYADDAMLRLMRVQSSFCRFAGGGDPGDPSCTDAQGDTYITPDYKWREGFRGGAVTVHDLTIGQATANFTGFASYFNHSLYQYAIYNPTNCDDPHNDNLAACAAPPVYVRRPDGTVTTTHFDYETLPSLFNEALLGGNATVSWAPGRHIGVTGYYSRSVFTVPNVDFQEWARWPYGGPFGAIGIDGAYDVGPLNLFMEATRSFDSEPQGPHGGYGIIQRSVYSVHKQEFELALRYYDRNFLNPYARAISEPDRLDGQRVRNEAGARIRHYANLVPDLFTRLELDIWTLPGDASTPNSAGTTNLRAGVRADYDGFDVVAPGLWFDYRNKGLGSQPNDQQYCYEVSTETDSEGDALPCTGQYIRFTERLDFLPRSKYANILLQGQEKWVDDPAYSPGMRMDVAAFAQWTAHPLPWLRARARTKYLDEAVDTNTRGERSVWSFVEATWLPNKGYLVTLRYDNYWYLDQRASTLVRIPNPSHRLGVEFQARF